ncbi:hypothetical protein CDD83_6798 [Cordyceps sp. RAO-2017]|nr:hypothetical protein CDD83_6798 [Cordyceps sp. RAO-2017]
MANSILKRPSMSARPSRRRNGPPPVLFLARSGAREARGQRWGGRSHEAFRRPQQPPALAVRYRLLVGWRAGGGRATSRPERLIRPPAPTTAAGCCEAS